jgi:hypothetical protein
MPRIRQDVVLRKALTALKEQLQALYPGGRLMLFGSAARGEMDVESDVAVLGLTAKPLTMRAQDGIVHDAQGSSETPQVPIELRTTGDPLYANRSRVQVH